MDTTWDCIVVGAGAAGLSAALVLGRARRRTLVIDAGQQSNRHTAGIGGLLANDRRPPLDFYGTGRAEVATYRTVDLRSGEVVSGRRDEEDFVLELADGSTEVARRVLLATGMEYRYPPLEGIEERWGRSVFHCPFCHGWEHRDRPLAVFDRGGALMLTAWSDDVTLLTDGPTDLTPEDRDRLEAAGVAIDERSVAALRGPDGTLTAVTFTDGSERPCGGLLIPVTLHQRSTLAAQLGAATNDPGPLFANALAVDAKSATTVPGLFAAGDAGGVMPSVANAVASGNTAAAMVVMSLMTASRDLAASAAGQGATR
jgi:thioredoxin reductase